MCGEVERREGIVMETMCFDFSIIVCADGMEIIDRRQKTYYCQLTPGQMVEYIEMEIQLALSDELERNRRLGCKGLLEI